MKSKLKTILIAAGLLLTVLGIGMLGGLLYEWRVYRTPPPRKRCRPQTCVLKVEPNRITKEMLKRHDNPDLIAKDHAMVDYGCEIEDIFTVAVWRIGIVKLNVCGTTRWYQCVLNWCFERQPIHPTWQSTNQGLVK